MKKGAFILTTETMMWIPRFILIVIVVLSVFFIVSMKVSKEFDIKEIETKLLTLRYLNSENCLAYKDTKVNPGIIDINKFNDENLDECLIRENFGAKLELKEGDKTIKTVFNGKDFFIDNNALCFSDKYYCTNKIVYVLYYDNGMKNGLLNINTAMRVK